MYPRSFFCEETKIKQRTSTSSKKQLCEIGEEAIWESRFTSFLLGNYISQNNYFLNLNFSIKYWRFT